MNLALICSLVAILGGGGLIGWWRATKPGRQRAEAGWDAILGGETVRDRSGGIIREGTPGLVSRVTTLEQAVSVLVDQDARMSRIEGRVDKLEIAEEARREIRAESTAMWRAVADQNIIDVPSEETP